VLITVPLQKIFEKEVMKTVLLTAVLAILACSAQAQDNVDGVTGATQVKKKTDNLSRLQIGGYGEAVMTRNFYSQSFNRYKKPENYANDNSHGRFDLPHVCLNIGYDFGNGWTMGSEIEFEHGGNGTAVEIEAEEAGEYEAEVEKGGEVNIEQFWINKAFANGKFNIKAGEIIVPVGYSNAYHEPNQFFTVYRPEGEATIMPNTWHQVGVSLWGRLNNWRYEAQFLSGLNSESFTAENFVHYGATSPYEFKVANNYAGALRVDNYSVKGLRVGLSGYYGYTFRNTLRTPGNRYDDVTGALAIVALDFTLKRCNWIVRGNVDYAHFSNADEISAYNQANWTHHKYQDGNPHHYSNIGSNAVAYAVEAGYNVFSQLPKLKDEKLFVFGRFEHYNTMASGTYASMYKYTKKYRCAVGLNYQPVKQITIKGEYSYRFFEKPNNNGLASDSPLYKQPYNNEPSVSVGVTYCGWLL
jgi:opacity protein-like surface antigen